MQNPTLVAFWRESFHNLSRTDKISSSFRLLGSNIYGLERGYNRKWTQSPVFTKSDTFSVNKTMISQFHNTEYCES